MKKAQKYRLILLILIAAGIMNSASASEKPIACGSAEYRIKLRELFVEATYAEKESLRKLGQIDSEQIKLDALDGLQSSIIVDGAIAGGTIGASALALAGPPGTAIGASLGAAMGGSAGIFAAVLASIPIAMQFETVDGEMSRLSLKNELLEFRAANARTELRTLVHRCVQPAPLNPAEFFGSCKVPLPSPKIAIPAARPRLFGVMPI